MLVGLGVDIEPAEPLPADLVGLVLNSAERSAAKGDRVAQRFVFVAKEAVYKAIHPLDGTPLEYADIEIALGEGMATLQGRTAASACDAGRRKAGHRGAGVG